MKKIMFNDRYGLTQAVLEGRKTQTRRIIKVQQPYKNTDIAFPVFVEDDWPPKNPLYGAFCWVNKDNPEEYTDWIRPAFKDSEVVAVAQSYRECDGFRKPGIPRWNEIAIAVGAVGIGWDNKMFVRANLMPHKIRITNVRIERLQDISDEDCLKEGIIQGRCGSENTHFMDAYYVPNDIQPYCTPREAFAYLIDKVSGKGTWESNTYVFVYDFELVK